MNLLGLMRLRNDLTELETDRIRRLNFKLRGMRLTSSIDLFGEFNNPSFDDLVTIEMEKNSLYVRQSRILNEKIEQRAAEEGVNINKFHDTQ